MNTPQNKIFVGYNQNSTFRGKVISLNKFIGKEYKLLRSTSNSRKRTK